MEQGAAMLLFCFKLIFMIVSALSNPRTEKHQPQSHPPCLSLEELTDQEGLADEYGHKESQGVTTSPNFPPTWGPPLIYPVAAASHTATAMIPNPASTSLPPALQVQPSSAEVSPLNWFKACFNSLGWDTALLSEQMLFPQSKVQDRVTSVNHSGPAGAHTVWNFSRWAHSTCPIRCPSDLKTSPREDRTAQHHHQQSDAGSTAMLGNATETGAAQLCNPYAGTWMGYEWHRAQTGEDRELQHSQEIPRRSCLPREQATLDGLNLQDIISWMHVAKSICFRGGVAFPVGFRNPTVHMALVMSHEIVHILLWKIPQKTLRENAVPDSTGPILFMLCLTV